MKKLIICATLILSVLACSEREESVQSIDKNKIENKNMGDITHRRGQNVENGDFILTVDNFKFVSGTDNKVSLYENNIWQHDISLSDYSYLINDNRDLTGEYIIKHPNNSDFIKIKNLSGALDDETFTFDAETSTKQIIKGVRVQNNNRFGSIVPAILELFVWLVDHLITSDGGTIGECRSVLYGCSNGGTMKFTTTSGWFSTNTSCSVICY